MDSHEERVYVAVRQTQEREAKQKMREKAKELSKLQRTQQLQRSMPPSIMSSNSSSSYDKPEPTVGDRAIGSISTPSVVSQTKPRGPSRALKLGSKGKNDLLAGLSEAQLVNELNDEVGSKSVRSNEYKDDLEED